MFCRYFLVTIIACLNINPFNPVHAQEDYEVNFKRNMVKDKALYGHTFLNLTDAPILDCFEYCVKNCLCVAFQICQDTQCQLLSSNRFLTPSTFLTKYGCTYDDISPREQFQVNNAFLNH